MSFIKANISKSQVIIAKNFAQATLGLFRGTVELLLCSQRPMDYHNLLEKELLEKDMPQEGSSWKN